MENDINYNLNRFLQTSLYHIEDMHFEAGLKQLPNKKVILWIENKIYFITDLLEKELLININSKIISINCLDNYIFYITTSESSLLLIFNNNYTLNKKITLFSTELLLNLDNNIFVFLETAKYHKKLFLMKIEESEQKKIDRQIIKNDIEIESSIKVCKITNDKFLFNLIENKYNEWIYFNIYSIEFKNKKMMINETVNYTFNYTYKFDYSFIPLNEKYLLQFSVNQESNILVIYIINIEPFQIIYKFDTGLVNDKINNNYNYFYNKNNPFFINKDIDEIPYFQMVKFFDEMNYNKIRDKLKDLDSKMKKGFKKLILRFPFNIENLYIVYFYENSKVHMENVDFSDSNNLINVEIKLINDDYNCELYDNEKYYLLKNTLYNEEDAMIFNEQNNYFILIFQHTDGWLHCCDQIISFSF